VTKDKNKLRISSFSEQTVEEKEQTKNAQRSKEWLKEKFNRAEAALDREKLIAITDW
jgi:hypothetical protein